MVKYKRGNNMTDMNFNNAELFSDCYCQKVLPLVYDNSLSYYEVLCKLTNKINELVDTVNELEAKLNEQNK
jgi:hypothetical protein